MCAADRMVMVQLPPDIAEALRAFQEGAFVEITISNGAHFERHIVRVYGERRPVIAVDKDNDRALFEGGA